MAFKNAAINGDAKMLSGYELNIDYIKEINSLKRKNLSLIRKVEIREGVVIVLAVIIFWLLMFIGLSAYELLQNPVASNAAY